MYSLSISIRKNTQILLCTLFSGWQKNYWYCFLLFFLLLFFTVVLSFPSSSLFNNRVTLQHVYKCGAWANTTFPTPLFLLPYHCFPVCLCVLSFYLLWCFLPWVMGVELSDKINSGLVLWVFEANNWLYSVSALLHTCLLWPVFVFMRVLCVEIADAWPCPSLWES